jgi:hypothetical protein
MPTRRKDSPPPSADGTAEDDNGVDATADTDDDADAEIEPDIDAEDVVEVDAETEDTVVVVEEDEDDDEEEDEVEAEIVAPPRPVPRPSPGRPPSAKEEPEPPFFVGERVVLVRNTRPRTGAPIADHPVGATGRVETVLSQTAIVRFDRAPDTKEVVAFTCLESLDEEAKARRAERDAQAAKGV